MSTIDKAILKERLSLDFKNVIVAAKSKAEPPEIECRGCDVCIPAVGLNALADVADPDALEATVCPAEDITRPTVGRHRLEIKPSLAINARWRSVPSVLVIWAANSHGLSSLQEQEINLFRTRLGTV